MTCRASHIRISIGQQESGRTVVEFGVEPIVKRSMTGLAGRRELCGDVVGIRRFLKIGQVARLACGRKPQVITNGGVLMALVAFHDSMRAQQRKSVEVLLNRLSGHLPAKNCVALGAVASELAAVHVRVTIRTILPHISEDRLDVALRAGDFLVQPAERIARRVVVEFGDRPNGRQLCRCGNSHADSGCSAACGNPAGVSTATRMMAESKPEHEHFQITAPRVLGLPSPDAG
jgi:hypothetical protein